MTMNREGDHLDEKRVEALAMCMCYANQQQWNDASDDYRRHWRQRAEDAAKFLDEYDRNDLNRTRAAFQASLGGVEALTVEKDLNMIGGDWVCWIDDVHLGIGWSLADAILDASTKAKEQEDANGTQG